MKINEIRELSTEVLVKMVKDLKEEMFVLKFQQATGKLEGAAKRRTIRKDIARIYTVLTEREGK